MQHNRDLLQNVGQSSPCDKGHVPVRPEPMAGAVVCHSSCVHAVRYVDLARARSPRGEVVLRERRADDGPAVLELRVNGVFVMDSRETGSERALATLALAEVERPRHVLVGGLGLGFTAREVLADRRVQRVVVIELEEALVDWMRDGTIPAGPALLADDRLTVVPGDLRELVDEITTTAYDLVLLDVDNGPGQLVHEQNAEIYRPPFLRRMRDLLRPGGAVAIWSADEAPDLAHALRAVFGSCTRIAHPVRLQERDEEYFLHVARRTAGAGTY
jgi:spermidine synthase